MNRLPEHVLLVLVTLWVGALWTVGYIVAPTLFGMIPDRMQAGEIAGRLFSLVAWVAAGCGFYTIVFIAVRQKWAMLRNGVFWLVAVMLLLTLASQLGIQPIMAQMKADAWPRGVMDSVLRDRFAAWHGVSSVLYLIQSVLGLMLVLGVRRLVR